ncbi:hypothetical protein [Shewanella frigidimarina]|uniref:Lipoprotein n=1 Tax=Shewanella frigidimarina (strain NCIMB 400) TaxID=318167 RepID=Q087V4_SHEFN|nr:hypothetical protein [Shewanella frigidimarina]ABI70461.1 hypothetical protein Sfri_0601 [Shewanella frigidimarina NCIMB 400]
MHHKSILAILISGALLVGCGSSDDDSNTEITQPDSGTPPPITTPPVASEYTHRVTGLAVYQGALSGATVCADLNQNLACDSDEPFTITDIDGNYQIDWKSEVETPDYYLVANWQAATATQAIQARSLALKVKNPTTRSAPRSIVSDAGKGTLIASPQYNGAINNLTHIKLSRVIEMKSQSLSNSDISQLSAELDTLLAILYQLDADTLYSISAETSASANFMRIDYAIAYLQQVIATQIPNLIAAEKILAATYAQLWQILIDSGLSIEEFFSDDIFTLAANILFSDSAIALGFTELPIDSRILSQNDWDVVLGNIINDSGFANTLSLALLSQFSTFSLDNDETGKTVIGSASIEGIGYVTEFPKDIDEQEIEIECWNTTHNGWYTIAPLPTTEPFIEGNSYKTVYESTDVNVTINVEKILTPSDSWSSILNIIPDSLKFNTLNWPQTLYSINVSQEADVMCREVNNYEIYDLPDYETADMITVDDIARAQFDSLYPEFIIVDEQQSKITLLDINLQPETTFTVERSISPSNQPLIITTEDAINDKVAEHILPTYYLVADQQLIEVNLNKAFDTKDANNQLMMTYDNSERFTQILYNHLLSLKTTP